MTFCIPAPVPRILAVSRPNRERRSVGSSAIARSNAALVTVKLRSSRYFLLASWLWLSIVLESFLTVDATFAPHEVALLVVIPILPSLILDLGWRAVTVRFGRWGERLGAVVVIAFLAVTSYANYADYFIIHVNTMEDTASKWNIKSLHGITQFYGYQVENGDLRAANPRAAIDHAPIPALTLNALPPPT